MCAVGDMHACMAIARHPRRRCDGCAALIGDAIRLAGLEVLSKVAQTGRRIRARAAMAHEAVRMRVGDPRDGARQRLQ